MKRRPPRAARASAIAGTLRMLLVLVALMGGRSLPAAGDYVTTGFVHDLNDLILNETNLANFGGLAAEPNYEWPPASGDRYLYSAGIWFGAIAGGHRHVSTSLYQFEILPAVDDPLDTIYLSAEGEFKGRRYVDDDGDGAIDEERRNGRDDDGDGLADEDYAAISPQMFSCRYSDYTPEGMQYYPDHEPLYVDIHQESYAWPTPEAFCIYHLEFRNSGPGTLAGVLLGIFADPDLGLRDHINPNNDRAAHELFWCDVGPLSLVYAWDDDGDVPGYSGTLLLGWGSSDPLAPQQRPVWDGVSLMRSGYPFPHGEPQDDSQRYFAMSELFGDPPQPADMRYLAAVGPYPALAPGETLWLDLAFVIGEGEAGMLAAAEAARRLYAADYQLPDVTWEWRWQPPRLAGLWPGALTSLQVTGPHPAGRGAAVRFELARPGRVTLSAYDTEGRRVARILEQRTYAAGRHTASWDGCDQAGRALAAGTYWLRLDCGGTQRVTRVVVVR